MVYICLCPPLSHIITKRKTPDHFLDNCFREFKDAEPRTPRLLRQPPTAFSCGFKPSPKILANWNESSQSSQVLATPCRNPLQMDIQSPKISSIVRKYVEISMLMNHPCHIEVSYLQHSNMKQAVGILQNPFMLTFCKSSVRCIGICAAQLYMNAAL